MGGDYPPYGGQSVGQWRRRVCAVFLARIDRILLDGEEGADAKPK